jgi:hypothetical protein
MITSAFCRAASACRLRALAKRVAAMVGSRV